jgi:hypothetical protein
MRLARAIAAGQLRRIDCDFAIVDFQGVQGGQSVLDHLDIGPPGRQRGAAGSFYAMANVSRNSRVSRQIFTNEDQAGIRCCGSKFDPDILSGPIPEPNNLNRASDGALASKRASQGGAQARGRSVSRDGQAIPRRKLDGEPP